MEPKGAPLVMGGEGGQVLLAVLQKLKILLMGDARSPRTRSDDFREDLTLCGNHNRSGDSLLGVGSMRPPLSLENEPGLPENAFENFPVERAYAWHS
jgi:hypothetical protein